MTLIERLITNQHYKSLTWGIVFLPLSFIFYLVLSLRKYFYEINVFKSNKVKVPVIVIGNITLGGTGKTPIIICLAKAFQKKKLNIGVIARGYKSKLSHVREVLESSNYLDVGDEPLLLKKKLECPLYVGANRFMTAKKLLDDYPNTDIILSDDGLQHYNLLRDFEIIVVDGMRAFGNKFLLPVGPLREPLVRLKNVDAVIINGSSKTDKKIFNVFLAKELEEKFFFSVNRKKKIRCDKLKDKEIIAMTGIGNPDRFFNTLKSKDIKFIKRIFPDHYEFKQKDFDTFIGKTIVMTEKDAIKCTNIYHNDIWVLPVALSIEKRFVNKILKKVGIE